MGYVSENVQKALSLKRTFVGPIKPRKSQECKRVLIVLIHLMPGTVMSCMHACWSGAVVCVGFLRVHYTCIVECP